MALEIWGGLLAALNRSDVHHTTALAALSTAQSPRLLSPFTLAKVDFMITTRVGHHAAFAFVEEVANGAYQLEPFDAADLRRALDVLRKYRDPNIGLADASLVVLADRHRCTDILTLDERHFRALRTGGGQPFRILPADAAA